MRRIGLFLGVQPQAGGMFQYAQSLLNAFATFAPDQCQLRIACIGNAWLQLLRQYRFGAIELKAGRLGLLLADASMATRLPASLARALATAINPIAWQLRRLDCDLWIFPAQDAITYQLRLPALATVHDLMHRYEPHFPEVVHGRRYQIREHRFRNLVAWARAVLVDSEVGRRQVVESYGADAAKVYPLPYIAPASASAPANSAGPGSPHELPARFFFYPAQFWAHKNHIALLDAAAQARAQCPDIHFVFTGGHSHEYEKVKAHAAALGMSRQVTFAGYVGEGELAELYRRARALVMPTFFGPTNIPPLEALSYGCPVAVSNIYAMPEQLGDAALYFDPRSVGEMAAVLQRLWLDDGLCEWLKAAGRRRLAAWTPVEFAARLRQILEEVLVAA